MLQTRLALVFALAGLMSALFHPWVAPPLTRSEVRTVWGGQMQQVQCWFAGDLRLACKLNLGEKEGTCENGSCWKDGGKWYCKIDRARKIINGELRRTSVLEDGYEVHSESGQEVWTKKEGGSDKTIETKEACFRTETCRDQCALVGSEHVCAPKNVAETGAQPHVDPDPNFPCPP